MSWPWSQLGLPGPSGLPEIRRAYAEKLKTTHPEDDPEGFQRLHSAYQLASRMARQRKRREGERPPQPQPGLSCPSEPEPSREDIDFDRLLEDGEEDPRRPREEEQDFNFDRLLQEGETPPRPPHEEEQDFDFERLFAEGEAERAEARRRRGEERRREQKRWEEQISQQLRQEEFRWQSTEAILHTVEMMYNARAGGEEWRRFFQNPLFQQSKGSLDLIFGLEDFVSTRDLTREARLALFLAYGFDNGVSKPELRPLYQMLLPAWRAEKQEKRQQKLYKLGTYIGGILLAPLILVFLGAGGLLAVVALLVLVPVGLAVLAVKQRPDGKRRLWPIWLLAFGVFTYVCYDRGMGLTIPLGILAAGFVCWVIWQVVKSGSMAKRARGETVSKKEQLRAMLGFVLAVAALAALSWLRTQPELDVKRLLPSKDPREQVCRYMEEDFGTPFQSIYNKTKLERHNNVFAPEDSVGDMFLAGPDGDRGDGRPGYTTNYPEMRMKWALQDFAKAHDIAGVDSMDRGVEQWDTSGTFLITLPFYGADDTITALGDLLRELSGERWYQARTPECEIILCGKPMKEGRLILTRWKPSDGAFDAGGVLTLYRGTLYKGGFAHTYCAKLLEELELDRNFLQDGETRYTLAGGGMAEMKGEECCKLYGLDESGAAALEYYVNLDGTNIYCVPGNFWEEGNSEEQLGFYRLLHREENLGLVNLFYPWIRVS